VASTFPPYTYDDDLIETTRRDARTRVRVYRLNDIVVVIGSGSQPSLEVDLAACEADGVPVLRRRGGGCSVVLDPGNVIVSVAAAGIPFGHHRRYFNQLTAWLIAGLAGSGVSGVKQAGICDLVIGDKKVAGACLHRSRDLLFYAASLLVDPDLSRVRRYLRHPPREPDYRRRRAHGEFMGSLSALSGLDHLRASGTVLVADRVAAALRQELRPPQLATSFSS